MKVLLIEDSLRLQRAVAAGLRNSGYDVAVTGDGEDGLWRAQSSEYAVIVLDLMLPSLDGLTLLRRLREGGNRTHVLILTAKDTVDDRVRGLRIGADDYLIKPFALEELLARVDALARRGVGAENGCILAGILEIDTLGKQARRSGQALALSPREFALLEYLAIHQGEVVSRAAIESYIYDEHAEPMSNVVDSAICALRRKIDLPGEPSFIETRRGQGYVLRRGAA